MAVTSFVRFDQPTSARDKPLLREILRTLESHTRYKALPYEVLETRTIEMGEIGRAIGEIGKNGPCWYVVGSQHSLRGERGIPRGMPHA